MTPNVLSEGTSKSVVSETGPILAPIGMIPTRLPAVLGRIGDSVVTVKVETGPSVTWTIPKVVNVEVVVVKLVVVKKADPMPVNCC